MIARKPFGRTGHESSRIVFGAANIWRVTAEVCKDTLQLLLKYGVNHIDVAASYGDGRAEQTIGSWMQEYRKQFFLATKTGKRTYSEAKEQLAGSLKRLGVDHVDMIQLHNLTDEEEWRVAMGPDGALKALVEARDQGLTRFIGVTGHGYLAPQRHLSSIERFPFDAVLLPFNYIIAQDVEYRNNLEELMALCRSRGIAVQTIKSIACRPWGSQEHTHACWYKPLVEERDIERAVQWALSNQDFVISSSDVTLLPTILEAAINIRHQHEDAEMKKLVARCGCSPIYDGARMITS
ncbi:MAG: aldo/keto reductase [archaeon]